MFLKISQYSQENTCLFLIKRDFCFTNVFYYFISKFIYFNRKLTHELYCPVHFSESHRKASNFDMYRLHLSLLFHPKDYLPFKRKLT